MLKLLVDKGVVSLQEWESFSDISTLNYQPFHNIVTIENNQVVLDKDKLLSLKPDDMYYWMYNIVDYVRKEYKR